MNSSLSIYDVTLVIAIGTLMALLLTGFVVLFFYTYKRKYKQHRYEVEKIKHDFEEVLLQSQLEIKEETLRHIAYELHDNLGQIASIVKIHLNTFPIINETQAAKIEDTKELVRQLIVDIKSLSVQLNSDRVVHLGIAKGLAQEVERLNKLGSLKAMLVEEGALPVLHPNTTIILYRMVQEIINNALKHSQAKQIILSIKATEKLITLACSDDGVGFSMEDKLQSGGSGLINLQNRAKLIHAQLLVKSLAAEGTTISIALPL